MAQTVFMLLDLIINSECINYLLKVIIIPVIQIMFSIPTNFSDKIKSQFVDLLVNRFNVGAINMVCQTILSLYSYNATSGVVVDIGDRIEILPVADGWFFSHCYFNNICVIWSKIDCS